MVAPAKEQAYDKSRINNIVYNDRLGYAIVYYQPNKYPCPRSEDICQHRRHQVLHKLEDPIDEKFHEEVEAMIRRKEREDAEKDIRKVCEKVHDLYKVVEEADLSRRELLNYRVKSQIKGKSSNEICDILVDDVLRHSKYIYQPKSFDDNVPHKMKLKILSAAIKRAPSPTRPVKKVEPEVETEESKNVLQRVEETLSKDLESDIHDRKYKRLLDKIQHDIRVLKYRCTEKIDFNYY
jgi:hypothetical protein